MNLREMFGFRVPIFSIVIGEGGSGGALAIGCSNRWAEVASFCHVQHRSARSVLLDSYRKLRHRFTNESCNIGL